MKKAVAPTLVAAACPVASFGLTVLDGFSPDLANLAAGLAIVVLGAWVLCRVRRIFA